MLTLSTVVLNQISRGRANFVASCRFFNNPKVTPETITAPLVQQTSEACLGKHVLVIQDTTEINHQRHIGFLDAADPDLGPTGNNKDIGFFLHPSIVIDRETGMLLGASDVHIWNRTYGQPGKHERDYPAQAIEEKESYRWISSAQRSKAALSSAASILVVSDREADIYEEFALLPDERCHVLVRSKENRRLAGNGEKLYEHLQAQPEAGRIKLQIRKAPGRQARQAHLTVRYTQVQIARPLKHTDQSPLPAHITLNAIWVEETPESVPAGERPIRWVLLATSPVDTLADALEIVRCYGLRWQIEILFASMKSQGMDVEASQLETGKALKAVTVMALITAIRINQLRLAREDHTGTPARIAFTHEQILLLAVLCRKLEGKTQKQKNPHPKNTLVWAAWVIARLGGWKGYASEAPPGNRTIYSGWRAFNNMLEGWLLAFDGFQ